MHPLETYYLNHAGRDLPSAPENGPIYSAPIYLQRGHGIGNLLGTLYRFVRPLLWTVGHTGGKIITDIAKNKIARRNRRRYNLETCRRCRHIIHTAANR